MTRTESADKGNRDLVGVARRTLSALSKELEIATELQGSMIGKLSGHLAALNASDDPADAKTTVSAMVSALQLEDSIRQRHQGVMDAVDVLRELLAVVAGNPDGERPEPMSDAATLWADRIVDSQRIEEMKRRLGACLARLPASPALESGDKADIVLWD